MLREQLHKIVEDLPESELNTAWRFLTYLRDLGGDPVLRAFSEAPVDDEPLTPEDEAAMREGEEQLARGERIPLEVVAERLRHVG